MSDTIAAIATPMGRGAIGIIRMSGPYAATILGRVWKSGAQPVDKFITHRLYLGNIIELSTGRIIDQVLATLMKGPNSYTGEDLIEVSAHGSPEILNLILGEFIKAGARMAEPGEFTKRAFLNGKIDLVQAEAVASLIASRSEAAVRIAEDQLKGSLSEAIHGLRDRLKNLLAFVEATIDFPDEDVTFIKRGEVSKKVGDLALELGGLIDSYSHGRILKEGIKTVLAGPPNAGKSSLLNAVLGKERAIVHHLPGTTRDTIEEEAILEGVLFRFVDTAGIHTPAVETGFHRGGGEVEEIGISKSREAIGRAELVLFVVDGHAFIPPDRKLLEELKNAPKFVIVLNKKDIGLTIGPREIFSFFGDRPIFEISAKTGEGLPALFKGLVSLALHDNHRETEGVVVTLRRHCDALIRARAAMEEAERALQDAHSAEFIALHLRSSLDALGEIIGEVTTEEILNEIFGSFCIGK